MNLRTTPSRPATDSEAIARSLLQPEAFAAIFDRHFTAVHRYLARRAGVGVADDLASQAFTVAFEQRRAFRASATSARPWLFGIATNLLRNSARAERRLWETLARLPLPPAHPDHAAQAVAVDGIGARLARAMATLPHDQRDVLALYAFASLSYEEIATSLQIPVGTVRSRLSRARAYLRDALAEGAVAASVSLRSEER